MEYLISYSAITDKGKRQTNQDTFICAGRTAAQEGENAPALLSGSVRTGDNALFGVFDGMGGGNCGGFAARMAARMSAGLKAGPNPEAVLYEHCLNVNAAVSDYACKNNAIGMGTTAALLWFSQAGTVMCNIGDSKVFRLGNDGLEQLSRDHLLQVPFLKRSVLTMYLGMQEDEPRPEPYAARLPLNKGDTFLICSDGLTDELSEEEISSVLKTHELAAAAGELMRLALEKGGKDNITLILLKAESSGSTVSQSL